MRSAFFLRVPDWLWLLIVSAALGTARHAPAQMPDTSSGAAQAVGVAYLNAISAADWKAAAGFLDLVPLDHYRLSQIANARQMRKSSTMTVQRLMELNPKMPRAVAEWQIEQMKDRSHHVSFLEYEFGVSDPDSLASMPMDIVAQRWVERSDPRSRLREGLRASGCPPAIADSAVPAPKFTVLGTIAKDGVAYMLYDRDGNSTMAFDVDDVRWSGPPMVVLRRRIGAWWVSPRLERNNSGALVSCSVNTPRRK